MKQVVAGLCLMLWALPLFALTSHSSVFHDQCTAGITAFTSTVYAKIEKDCKECHGGANPDAPPYASGDNTSTYYAVLNYVNFSDIPDSTLVLRAGNGHCGKSNCNSASGADMLNQVKAWYAQGQNTCPVAGNYFTAEVPVPTNLPDNTQTPAWQTLQWDMSTISVQFAGYTFGLDMQYWVRPTSSDPGAYRFREPRVLTGTDTIHIANIKVLINHTWNSSDNDYTVVDRIVSPQTGPSGQAAPYPTLSADEIITFPQGTTDKISVAFNVLESDDPVPCNDESLFTSSILPYLHQGTCYSCHGGEGGLGTSPANLAFNMDVSNARLCQGVRERTNFSEPIQSLFLSFGARGKFDHPTTLPDADTFAQDYIAWVQQENSSSSSSKTLRRAQK